MKVRERDAKASTIRNQFWNKFPSSKISPEDPFVCVDFKTRNQFMDVFA